MDPSDTTMIANLSAEHDATLARVRAANQALSARLREVSQFVYYDAADDTLIVTEEPEAPYAVLEVEGELWLHIDPATDRVLGYELPTTHDAIQEHPVLADGVQDLIRHASQAPATFVPLTPSAGAQMAEHLGTLLAA